MGGGREEGGLDGRGLTRVPGNASPCPPWPPSSLPLTVTPCKPIIFFVYQCMLYLDIYYIVGTTAFDIYPCYTPFRTTTLVGSVGFALFSCNNEPLVLGFVVLAMWVTE